jgi:hypothetical protein
VVSGVGTNGGGIELVGGGQSGGGNISALAAGGLTFGSFTGAVGSEAYSERARIDASGRLGVATATPTGWFTAGAGTTAIAPIVLTSGTNLTSAAAGAMEYDGTQLYYTIDTSSGRAAVPAEQHFALTAAGGSITTIANFFGTTSNPSLVSGAYYEMDIYLFYTTAVATGAVTWTLTNSAAPTNMSVYYEMSPITGIVAPPGTATALVGQSVTVTAAAYTVTTGTLSIASHYARFKIWLLNSTGTSLKIQATTTSTQTLTPIVGSRWFAKRVSTANVGTFSA